MFVQFNVFVLDVSIIIKNINKYVFTLRLAYPIHLIDFIRQPLIDNSTAGKNSATQVLN